jgi:hypothetical protein
VERRERLDSKPPKDVIPSTATRKGANGGSSDAMTAHSSCGAPRKWRDETRRVGVNIVDEWDRSGDEAHTGTARLEIG